EKLGPNDLICPIPSDSPLLCNIYVCYCLGESVLQLLVIFMRPNLHIQTQSGSAFSGLSPRDNNYVNICTSWSVCVGSSVLFI
ncbi:hypothetical protein L9F63_001201, partial [Diploptera punctata]